MYVVLFFFFQAEDGIRDGHVTGVQTCALPISRDSEIHHMAGLQAIQLEAGASAIIGQREGVNGELGQRFFRAAVLFGWLVVPLLDGEVVGADVLTLDRKSTRLNSSHVAISYAV